MTLQHTLQTLEISGLVRLITIDPEQEYLFQHVLVQEATYHTLVRQDRRRLHQAVGQTLERLYPERRTELAPMLAVHFAEAGDPRRALGYYVLAADEAARRYANAEAAMHYRQAVALASAPRPETVDTPSAGETTHPNALPPLSELYSKLGRSLELSGQYHDALVTYQSMLSLARARSDETLELDALVLLAQSRSTPNANFDAGEGATLSTQALALARRLGDQRAEVRIRWSLVNLGIMTGRIAESIQNAEAAIPIARERGLREELAYILNDSVRAYLSAAQLERGLLAVTEAASLWRELRNLPMLTDSLSTLALFYLFSGRYDEVIQAAAEASQLSHTIHSKWGESYSRFGVGRVYWDRGDPERAIAVMEESIRLSFEAGFMAPQLQTRCELALVYASLGAVQTGIDLAHEVIRTAQSRAEIYQSLPQATLSILYLLQGDQSQAEAALHRAQADFDTQIAVIKPTVYQASILFAQAKRDFEHASDLSTELIEYLREFQMRYAFADALYLQGCSLLAQGRVAESQAALLEAQRAANELGARRIEWQILSALSDIAALNGQPDQAADLRHQVREMLDQISAHTPLPLRDSFHSLPEVQSLLQD